MSRAAGLRHDACRYNSCCNRHCPKCQGRARGRGAGLATSALLPRSSRRLLIASTPSERRSSTSCFGQPPRRCASLPPTPNISVPRSVSSRCCTAGPDPELPSPSPLHHARRRPSPDGTRWIACRPNFFYRSECYHVCSDGCLQACSLPSRPDNYSSSVISPNLRTRRRSPPDYGRCRDWVVYAKHPSAGQNSCDL